MDQPEKKVSAHQFLRIYELLTARVEVLEDGFARYVFGSEQEVASKVGVSVSIVAEIRRELFGKICREDTTDEGLVISIEQRLAKLEEQVATLTKHVDFLFEKD